MSSLKDWQVDLERIASSEYQQKYCVNGTASEYVLLDELLDTLLYAIRHYLDRSTRIPDSERMALQQFLAMAEPRFDQIPWSDRNVSISQIVDCDAMKEIREAAAKCLQKTSTTLGLEEL